MQLDVVAPLQLGVKGGNRPGGPAGVELEAGQFERDAQRRRAQATAGAARTLRSPRAAESSDSASASALASEESTSTGAPG